MPDPVTLLIEYAAFLAVLAVTVAVVGEIWRRVCEEDKDNDPQE